MSMTILGMDVLSGHRSPRISKQKVEKSLAHAVTAVRALQRQDGSWPGENFCGPIYTAMLVVVEAYLGHLSERDATEALRWFRHTQLPGGAFPDYPTDTVGSLRSTAFIYAALIISNTDSSDPLLISAKAYIDQQGGLGKCDYEVQLYLVMAGLLPAKSLGRLTLFFKLIPGAQRFLGTKFGLEMVIASNQLPLMVYGFQHPGTFKNWRHPLLALERWITKRYLVRCQNPAGNWVGILMPTLWGLICYRHLGVAESDSIYQNALKYLDHWKVYTAEGLRVVPYMSEIWNTALMVRALIMSRQKDTDEAIKQGLNYLLTHQSNRDEPADWQNPAPGAPRTGGWPYEQDNPLCCDCDTTAAVLWTLALAKEKGYLQDNREIDQGLAWLMAMQNPDGGWGAFAHNLGSKPAGPMFTKPLVLVQPSPGYMLKMFLHTPVEWQDPATEGLTGRVLSALGALGMRVGEPPVDAAIAFLNDQVADNGAWWGRWEVNFLAASGCVLSGMAAVGHTDEAAEVVVARKWMLEHQNSDRGWGEAIESYRDPALAGQGPSCGTITGAVVAALLDSMDADHPQLVSGIDYLVTQQQQDGLWLEPYPLYLLMPPNSLYNNRVYSQYSPIEALSKYCAG